MDSVHSILSLTCIVKKLDQGSLDAEFVDGVIHNQLQSEPMSKIHENEREKIKKLATSIANLKSENMPMNAKTFMARLRDSFELQVTSTKDRHVAMVAVPEPRVQLQDQQRPGKKFQDRRDATRPSSSKADPEPQEHHGKSIDQKINDLFSIVGQSVKKLDQLMQDRGQENRPSNGCQDRYRNQDGYKDKQRQHDSRDDSGRGQRSAGSSQKQFAGKAQAQKSKKGKTTFKRGNSSDDDNSSDEDDQGQHKAYYAYLAQPRRAVLKTVNDQDGTSSPTFKLYGKGPSRQPQPNLQLADLQASDHDSPSELVSVSDGAADEVPLSFSVNGGDRITMSQAAVKKAEDELREILAPNYTSPALPPTIPSFLDYLPGRGGIDTWATVTVDKTRWEALPEDIRYAFTDECDIVIKERELGQKRGVILDIQPLDHTLQAQLFTLVKWAQTAEAIDHGAEALRIFWDYATPANLGMNEAELCKTVFQRRGSLRRDQETWTMNMEIPALENCPMIPENSVDTMGQHIMAPTDSTPSLSMTADTSRFAQAAVDEEPYLLDPVVKSPAKRRTRLQTRQASLVYPEPDLPSDIEDLPVAASPAGRPTKRKATTTA